MKEIVKCNADHYPALCDIWERSVRASHSFLSEADITQIKEALIPEYFPTVDLFGVRENGVLAGFIGVAGDRIEMLFIDSNFMGRGYGSLLIEHALESGCRYVDVNEQNQAALKFYLSKGFIVTGRDEMDDAGRPYPILHLSLQDEDIA